MDCRLELMSYARSLLGSYSAADDVVQEALLVVFKKYDQFREGTSMLAWCRSIVRIEVLRARQRQQRDRTLADCLLNDAISEAFDEFQLERRKDQAESWRDALRGCFENVPQRGQKVLTARFTDDLSYQQIGDSLGMSIEAVRKALFRLKKQIRSCVETRLRTAHE